MSLERLRKPLLIGVPVLLVLGLGVLWLLGGVASPPMMPMCARRRSR